MPDAGSFSAVQAVATLKGTMKKFWKSFIGILLIVMIILALPVIIKEKKPDPLVGPELGDMTYTEVFFENPTDGLILSGMLFMPAQKGPCPTAVIIQGSGPSRRNNTWYLSVARYLQDNGIAVLLPDKRGSEKSEGNWRGVGFEELATDSMSALQYLKQQDAFVPSSIGVIGMSQGGWIAPIVASKATDVAWVVSMVGAVVTPEEQLLHEEIHNISKYTYQFIARLIAPMSSKRIMEMDFFKPFLGFDPIVYWKNVDSPVFFAFGGNDENVPVKASLERLKEHHLDPTLVKVYTEGGHAIRDPETNKVNPAFLSDLEQFIVSAN